MNADGVPSSYGELIDVLFALPVLIREKRRRDGLSLRAAGKDSGVGFNTVNRTERGEHCSLENVIRLFRWLDGASRPTPDDPEGAEAVELAPDSATAREAGPDAGGARDALAPGDPSDGHAWHFRVTGRGSSRDSDGPYSDSEIVDEPWTVDVRAWSLSAACQRAADLPLAAWTHEEADDSGVGDAS